jgi:hypothetical protein
MISATVRTPSPSGSQPFGGPREVWIGRPHHVVLDEGEVAGREAAELGHGFRVQVHAELDDGKGPPVDDVEAGRLLTARLSVGPLAALQGSQKPLSRRRAGSALKLWNIRGVLSGLL